MDELPFYPQYSYDAKNHHFGYKGIRQKYTMFATCSHFAQKHTSLPPCLSQTTISDLEFYFPDCEKDHTIEQDVIWCSLPELPWNIKLLEGNDNTGLVFSQWRKLAPYRITKIVDTEAELERFLMIAGSVPKYTAELFMDEEGYNGHGRDGVLATF